MSSRIIQIFVFSMLFLCFGGVVAHAQSVEDLKNRLAEAAAMTKEDMTEALRQYLEIRTVYAGENVDYSLGRVYHRLNQCKEAQYYYTQVMVAYNLPDSNPVYQRAVKAYDEIAACEEWQKVYLECDIPAGGYVMIDNERVGACWSRPYSLEPGEHVFKLFDASGKSQELKFKAGASKEAEHLKLAFSKKKASAQTQCPTVAQKEIVERVYVEKEKFSPALYWGLIAGGAAVVAVGGFMSGVAHSAHADEIKYAYQKAIFSGDSETNNKMTKKVNDAHDRVKLGNTLMATFVGIGGAAVVAGAALAIVSYVNERERVEVSGKTESDDGIDNVSAYLAPSLDGVSIGVGFQF